VGQLSAKNDNTVSICAVILTFNEEANIDRCINSIRDLVDEILVVDSFSTDKTGQICKKLGARFVQHQFEGFIEQKNWGISLATHTYILSIEGDEALSDELRESIRWVKHHWSHDVYDFNRLTRYCGKWITHSGWYPEPKLRLFDRRKGRFGGSNPHDTFILKPGAKKHHLKGNLLHFGFNSISEHMDQTNKYSDIKAMSAYEKGRQSNWFKIVFNPSFRFFRNYFLRLGFLDGFYGFVVCSITAYSNFLKYTKLMQLELEKKDGK